MGRKHRRKTATTPPSESPTSPSSRWRFFVWICVFFFFAALVMRLDVITAWPGAEGFALDHALSSAWGENLRATLNHFLLPLGTGIDAETDAIFLFPRLLSVLCLLLTGFFSYRWGKRLFGTQATQLGLLCAAASLFLPFFGKVATPDSMALLGHAGMFFTALLHVVAGEDRKALAFGIFTLIASIAAPLATVALGLVLVGAAVVQRGEKRWRMLAGIGLGVSALVLVTQGGRGTDTYWFHTLGNGKTLRFIAYSFLGSLPFIGFVAAGLRDLVFKVRKREQFSLILLTGLLAGILAQSLLFPFLLAFLAGKQMQLYFREPNYPWKDFVRSGAVLHIVAAFIGVFVALAGGGIAFPGAGFRAALGMAAAYWIFSLLGVIGLFGDKRDFALGGTLLAGLLGVMFFWVQVYPYLEAERSWPKRLVEQAGEPGTLVPPAGDETDLSMALPYFRRAGWEVSEKGDAQLFSGPVEETAAGSQVQGELPQAEGRVVLQKRVFRVDR